MDAVSSFPGVLAAARAWCVKVMDTHIWSSRAALSPL